VRKPYPLRRRRVNTDTLIAASQHRLWQSHRSSPRHKPTIEILADVAEQCELWPGPISWVNLMFGQIETALLTIVGSSFGAWIAARLAFTRFSREKIWERKAAAYTAIFEALHYIGRWYEKHYEASIEAKEIDDEKTKQLKADANKAEDELERRLASETWLLPAHCRLRLKKMIDDLKNSAYRHTMWQEFLEDGGHIISTATDDLRNLVEIDLGLRARSVMSLRHKGRPAD
jgi:hypothetical protein